MSYDGSRVAQPLDTTHSPVGLWKLDGNLLDSSGNGYHLTAVSTAQYSDVIPGMRGFGCFNNQYAWISSDVSALRIYGSVTVQAICVIWSVSSNGRTVVQFGANGETNATNSIYGIQFINYDMNAQWEHSSGVNAGASFSAFPPIGVPVHLAFVRDQASGNASNFYMNGRLVGYGAGPYTAPDGGSSSRLYVGFNGASGYHDGVIASVKVIAGALSAADIRAEYNRSLGIALGRI